MGSIVVALLFLWLPGPPGRVAIGFDEGRFVLEGPAEHRVVAQMWPRARLISSPVRGGPPYRHPESRSPRRASGRVERRGEIRDQVVDRLDPDRQPDEGRVDFELR